LECRNRFEKEMKKVQEPRLDKYQERVQEYFERPGPQQDPEEAGATPRGDDDVPMPEIGLQLDSHEPHEDIANPSNAMVPQIGPAVPPQGADAPPDETMLAAVFRSTEGEAPTEREGIVQMLCHVGVDVSTAERTVSELYSPPRVTAAAAMRRGLNIFGLQAFDMTTLSPEGAPADFSKAPRRAAARRMRAKDNPDWLTGSPPCTAFSILNRGLNYPKMPAEKVERVIIEGRVHLAFCCQLYKDQLDRGKHFLCEHPASASSWWEKEVM
jgi:hypothetical protein